MAPIENPRQLSITASVPSFSLRNVLATTLASLDTRDWISESTQIRQSELALDVSPTSSAAVKLIPLSPRTVSLPKDLASDPAKLHIELQPRQDYIPYLPLTYDFTGPMPGVVVGIVLGVTAGIILIVILFWTAFAVGGGQEEVVVVANSDGSQSDYLRSRRSRRSRRRRSSKYEMHQRRSHSQSRSPPPPRRPRTERIIVQETRRTESRPPHISVDSPMSPAHSHRVDGDDVVEVIEEQSEISSSIPPPRRKSKRSSGTYRVVDPDAYAGGNYAPRDVYDDRRRSKR